MIKQLSFVAAVVMSMSMAACGGGGGGGGGTYCVVGSGTAQQTCTGFKDESSTTKDAEKQACSQNSGTIVSSCPTASLVGCCTYDSAGYTTEACYYEGTADQFMSACESQSNGTWSTSP